MSKCSCGGEKSLAVRILPKPYEYRLVCTCGKSTPADEGEAREAISCATAQALVSNIKDGINIYTQKEGE
jgi:hypothetical protein